MPTLKLGSTTALTESSGALTINVANPTVTLGSNATFGSDVSIGAGTIGGAVGGALGWRLLESVTANDNANITIGSATTLSSTFDDYMIVGTSIRTHTAGTLLLRMTIGGSELTSAYLTVSHGMDSNATETNVTSASYAYAFLNSGSTTNNNAYDRFEFKMYLSSPTSTVFHNRVWGIASYTTNMGYARNASFTARHNTTGALTAIKIYPGSGNITGTCKLYGLEK